MQIKRLSIVLMSAAAVIALPSYAAYPAATDPTEVSVPELPGGFFVGATGLFLQPTITNGDLNYSTRFTVNNTNSDSIFSTTSNVESVQPDYQWGVSFDAGYTFPGTGNDIRFNFTNLGTNDNNGVTSNDVDNQFVFATNLDSIPFTTAESTAEVTLNQADLVFGQLINVGCRLSLHPNVGVRYAQIERKLNTNYFSNLPDFPLVNVANDSNFNGVGPLVGMDATYYLGAGVGVVGHFDTALLAGHIDSSLTNTFNMNDGTVITNSISDNSSTRVVPVIDAKLGLNYTYIFDPHYTYSLSFEGGYQVSNYFNAVDKINAQINTGVAGGMGIPSPLTSTISGVQSADLQWNGPYISLVYHA